MINFVHRDYILNLVLQISVGPTGIFSLKAEVSAG